MNYSEHTMRASSVTRDRRTINQGWAGFHARRPALPVRLWRRYSRAAGWLVALVLLLVNVAVFVAGR